MHENCGHGPEEKRHTQGETVRLKTLRNIVFFFNKVFLETSQKASKDSNASLMDQRQSVPQFAFSIIFIISPGAR